MPSKGDPFPGWTFFRGYDSARGDIGCFEDDDFAVMVQEATARPECKAFNTNGWLKHSVLPKCNWDLWTVKEAEGLYVRNELVDSIRNRPTGALDI